MHDDTIYATELQGIREFGTESVLMQVESEVARRLSGPTGLLASVEYTKEFMRLAARAGPDGRPEGRRVLYNWFDEFQITQDTEIGFNLAAGTAEFDPPDLQPDGSRSMARKAQGAFTAGDAREGAVRRHCSTSSSRTTRTSSKHLRQLVRREGNPLTAARARRSANSSSRASRGSTIAARTTTPRSRSPTTR
jgi:hypothetical protein